MSYKEFKAWCNARAADGCWGVRTALICSHIISTIDRMHWWQRKKAWQKFIEEGTLMEIVERTNKTKREMKDPDVTE